SRCRWGGEPPNSCSLPSGFQRHLEPKLLQATDGLPFNGRSLSLIKVVTAQVLIGLLTLQDVIGNDENGVRYSHHCPLFAPSVRKPSSLRAQVRVFGTHRPLRSFNKGLTQPAIPFARGATKLFPGTVMIAGTDADPRG